jgi:hypothetical protein
MLAILVIGIVLMADGHKAGMVLEIHKVSFILWIVLFGVHLLAHFVRALRLVLADLRLTKGDVAPGIGFRTMLLVSALGGGSTGGRAAANDPPLAPLIRDDAVTRARVQQQLVSKRCANRPTPHGHF